MNKKLGYLVSIIGLLLILLCAINPIKDKMPAEIKKIADNTVVFTVAIVIFIIGLLIVYQTRSRKMRGGKEVPIYKENQIIGYRRV